MFNNMNTTGNMNTTDNTDTINKIKYLESIKADTQSSLITLAVPFNYCL